MQCIFGACLRLAKHKRARARPSMIHTFQMNQAHMFPRAAMLAWCITWNYDSAVIFMILIRELELMQPSQLWGFHHKSPRGPFRRTHKHMHTESALVYSIAHSHSLWTSGFMVCEQHSFFFFFFMRGLRQTVFGANWSLCCTLSHLLEHISLFARNTG